MRSTVHGGLIQILRHCDGCRSRSDIAGRIFNGEEDRVHPTIRVAFTFSPQLERLAVAADGDVVQGVAVAVSILDFIAGDLGDVDVADANRAVTTVIHAGDKVAHGEAVVTVSGRPQRRIQVRNKRDCWRSRIRRVGDRAAG